MQSFACAAISHNIMTCHTSCLQCKPAGRTCVVAPLLYTFHAFRRQLLMLLCLSAPSAGGLTLQCLLFGPDFECDALSLGNAAKQKGLGRRRNCTPHGYFSSSSGLLGDSSSVTWIILLHKEPDILPLKRLYAVLVLCCTHISVCLTI